MFGPIRTLCLAAGLYLPLALFIWFAFAVVVVTPVLWLVQLILLNLLPELFLEVSRNGYQIALLVPFVSDPSQLNGLQPGQTAGVDVLVNPMIYGYGLPVIAGLALATPTTLKPIYTAPTGTTVCTPKVPTPRTSVTTTSRASCAAPVAAG